MVTETLPFCLAVPTAQVNKYILCLDTDKYAGNFERQTTAYATGITGGCGVGDTEAELFAELFEDEEDILDEIENKVLQVMADDGCSRPCAIQITPGWVNDRLGNEYRQSKGIPPTVEQIHEWFPAYYSVGIFLSEPLSDVALKLVLSRAKEYLTKKGVTLEQVRLITEFSYTKSKILDDWKS